MLSKKIKPANYVISNIDIKGNLISWENHSIYTLGISQIWIGPRPPEPFPVKLLLVLLFIALSSQTILSFIIIPVMLAASLAWRLYLHYFDNKTREVNIELCSGEVITFTANSQDSQIQFYNSLKDALGCANAYEIKFSSEGEVIKESEDKTEKNIPYVMEISENIASNQPLAGELQKLYLNYTKKSDADSKILLLINDAGRLLESGDREGLKDVFKNFVILGLISDCNELGLDSLLLEIKNSLY